MSLSDSYFCERCPGQLRISPASEAEKHREWHRERERKRATGEYVFGSAKITRARKKHGIKRGQTKGYKLKRESIPIKAVNRAMGDS